MLGAWKSSNLQFLTLNYYFSLHVFVLHTPTIVWNHLHFSLVQILFSFVFGMVMYDNKFKRKDNKIWTANNIEQQLRR